MLKTIKAKVIAGVAAVLLVSGASAAFGASDAGTKLRAWFDTQFSPAKVVVENEAKTYLSNEMDGFHNVFNGLITDGTDNIQNTGMSETGKAKVGIETVAGEHIDSIINTQNEIERYMNSEFTRLKSDAETRLNEATAEFNNDGYMRRQLNQAATDARNALKLELDNSISDALSDIDNAIKEAKSELLTSLQDKSIATTESIKLEIDKKIAALSKTFSDAQKQIVSVHLVTIENLAKKMENDAKEAMQALVDGI